MNRTKFIDPMIADNPELSQESVQLKIQKEAERLVREEDHTYLEAATKALEIHGVDPEEGNGFISSALVGKISEEGVRLKYLKTDRINMKDILVRND